MRFKEFLLEAVAQGNSFALQYKLQLTTKSDLNAGLFSKDAVEESVQAIVASLAEDSGKAVTSRKPTKTSWNVIVNPEQKSNSTLSFILEIPCLTLNAANKAVAFVSTWTKEHTIRTSDADSLTLSIAVKDLKVRFDPIKFVLFMGKDYMNSAFGKKNVLQSLGNPISDYTLKNISYTLKTTGRLPANVLSSFGSGARSLIKNSITETGLDFSIISGTGYQHHTDFIKDKISSLLTNVDIACDTASQRKEYYDMFMNLVKAPIVDDVEPVDEELMTNLGRFIEVDPDLEDAWHHFKVAKDVGDSKISFMTLIDGVLKAANKANLHLTRDEKQFLKSQSKAANITDDDLDSYFKNDSEQRLNVKRITFI